MPEGLAHVEGRIVDVDEARVALLDRGHLLGDGVFETLRIMDGTMLHRARHEQRLRRGLELLGCPAASADAWDAADQLLAQRGRLGSKDLQLRIQVTTGIADDVAGEPGRYVVTAILRPRRAYPARFYDPGVALVVSVQRKPAGPLSVVKTVSFLPHVFARRQARLEGAEDALLLNGNGRVCEATTSNVFAVVDGHVHAPGPEEDAVDGVTRGLLVEALAAEGVPVRTRLDRDALDRAQEIVLTNALAGAVPVRRMLARDLPGARGRFFAALRARLEGLDALRVASKDH